MVQKRPIRFTQRLGVAQFDRLQETADKLGVAKAEITRTALDEYLDKLGSLSHEIRTPVV